MIFNRNGVGPVILLSLLCFFSQLQVVHCGWCAANVCGNLNCGKGQFCYDSWYPKCNYCAECAYGQYQDDSNHDWWDQCMSQTTSCGSGEYLSGSPNEKKKKNDCEDCPTGQYKTGNNDRTSCLDQTVSCGSGERLLGSPNEKKRENSCEDCPTGQYKTGDNERTSCTSCNPGQYQDEKGKGSCKLCPYGQFQDEKAKEQCKSCGSGRYTENKGSTDKGCLRCTAGTEPNADKSTCVPCAAGQYSKASTNFECKRHKVVTCEEPTFKEPREDPTQQTDGVCERCKATEFYSSNINVAANGCASYLNGEYIRQGTTEDGADYFLSNKGRYLYHDENCGPAAGSPNGSGRWIFDESAPSITAAHNLDGDGKCSYDGSIEDPPNEWKINPNLSAYMYMPDAQKSWSDAASDCASVGASLLSIKSEEENNFVRSAVLGSDVTAWIGATDAADEGTWVWQDGSSAAKDDTTFHKWDDDEPNDKNGDEDCATIITTEYALYREKSECDGSGGGKGEIKLGNFKTVAECADACSIHWSSQSIQVEQRPWFIFGRSGERCYGSEGCRCWCEYSADKDCGYTSTNSYDLYKFDQINEWNDLSCSKALPFVCKKKAATPIPPTGTREWSIACSGSYTKSSVAISPCSKCDSLFQNCAACEETKGCTECPTTGATLFQTNATRITHCVSEDDCKSSSGWVTGKKCAACHADCNECSGKSVSQCTKCGGNRFLAAEITGRCVYKSNCGSDMFGDATSNTCLKCAPGLVPAEKKGSCYSCTKNKYEDVSRPGECTACPPGKVTSTAGKDSIGSCVYCTDHTYQDTQGDDCKPCPGGLVVTRETYELFGLDRCTCPPGQVLNDPTDKSQGCTACEPGTAQQAISVAASGCASYLNGLYTRQGTTKDGKEFFKRAVDGGNRQYYFYHDKNCDGAAKDQPDRWYFDKSAPSTTASHDLDGDGKCSFNGFIESSSVKPPTGTSALVLYCDRKRTTVNLTLNSACSNCSPGFFQDKPGQTRCTQCNDNQFQLESGGVACDNCDPTCSACVAGEPETCTACTTFPQKLYLDQEKKTCNTECPGGYKKNYGKRLCVEREDVHPPEFQCDLSCPKDLIERAWDPARSASVWWMPPSISDNVDLNVTVKVEAFPYKAPTKVSMRVRITTAAVEGAETDEGIVVEFRHMNGEWSAPELLANGAKKSSNVTRTFSGLLYLPTKVRISLNESVDSWAYSKVEAIVDGQDLVLGNQNAAVWVGPRTTSREYALDFTPRYKQYVEETVMSGATAVEVSRGDKFDIGSRTILYTATDAAGNYQYYHFTIRVAAGDRSDCDAAGGGRQRKDAIRGPNVTKKQRRAEQVHERRKRFGFDHQKEYIVNHATGAKLQVYSVGEHAADMVSLIDHPTVVSVECALNGITMQLVLPADTDGTAASIVQAWPAGTLFAIDKSFGCLDKVSRKRDSVYRRAAGAAVILHSTFDSHATADGPRAITVQYATSDASFAECFAHAEVRYDYHPGIQPHHGADKHEHGSQHQQQDYQHNRSRPFSLNGTHSEIARERHRRSWFGLFPWVIKEECFLGICYDMNMNYNPDTERAAVSTFQLGKADNLEVVCVECFAMLHAGLHFYLRVDAFKLTEVRLSVVAEARAEMNFEATAEAATASPSSKQVYDSGEIASAEVKIPITVGAIVMRAKASVQLYSKYEIDVRGTTELKLRAALQRKYEQGIRYVDQEGWSRINPEPIKKMEFKVEKFTMPESITAKVFPIMPQLNIELEGGLQFVGGLAEGTVGLQGLTFQLQPYIMLGASNTEKCEPNIEVSYGIDWGAWVDLYFARVSVDIWIKKWTKQLDIPGHPLGSGVILKKTKLFDKCKKRLFTEWQIGSWKACTGTRRRVVECRDQDGKSAFSARCPLPVPPSSESCEYDCRKAPSGCSGHGNCQEVSGKCDCQLGWKGDESCSTYSCDSVQCNAADGIDRTASDTCSGPNQCRCEVGYSGPECSIAPCDELNQCVNGAGCVNPANGNAGCDCNQGWRRDPATGKCNIEFFACKEGNVPNGCRWCGEIVNTCHTCNQGFEFDKESQKCEAMEKECSPPSQWLYQGVCEEKCPLWTYNTKNGACEECHPTCRECTGPGENECTDCRLSKYLSKTSPNNKFCCNPGFFGKVGSAENGCQDNPCKDLNCKHCTSATTCTQCRSPFVLVDEQCSASCGAGFFIDDASPTQNAQCKACHVSCASCSSDGSGKCTSCSGKGLLADGRCKTTCPTNTIEHEGSCIKPFVPEGQPERFCDPNTCPESYRGDGECDRGCNNRLCSNDRGDCTLGGSATYCSTLLSCSSCQSASGCGWCPSSQLCHNYTYSHEHVDANVGTCDMPLMVSGCLLHPFEESISVVGNLSDVYPPASVEWAAGEEQTLVWNGGRDDGVVTLDFRVEGGNWVDGVIMMMENATNPLPNTGIVRLKLPAEMPPTCALEFRLTSDSKETNTAYTCDIIVKASARRHGRALDVTRGAWSSNIWGGCNRLCGGGVRTRNTTCVDYSGNAVDDVGYCDGANPINLEKECNTHACQTDELKLIASQSTTKGGVWLVSKDQSNTLLVNWIGGLSETANVSFQLRQTPDKDWRDVPSSVIKANTAVLDVNGMNLPSSEAYQLKIRMQTHFGLLSDVSDSFSICPSANEFGRCTSGIDRCAQNPCSPAGTSKCTTNQAKAGFSCKCKKGYEGRVCGDVTNQPACPNDSMRTNTKGKYAGLCRCKPGNKNNACSTSEDNKDCVAVYDTNMKSMPWLWLFPDSCKTCKCDQQLSLEDSTKCNDCGGDKTAMQCVDGVCECKYGYRRMSDTNPALGCVLDIQFTNDQPLKWKRGEQVNITWTAFGEASIRIDLIFTANGSEPTVVACLTRETPNVGLFVWTVANAIAVKDTGYEISVAATHDPYRAFAKMSVSVAYGDKEFYPGLILSPAEYATVRALKSDTRVQWRPPTAQSKQRKSDVWPMTLVMASVDTPKQEPVVVVRKLWPKTDGVNVGSIMLSKEKGLPEFPGMSSPTPAKLMLRNAAGTILSDGPIFLLEPCSPAIAIEALLVRMDKKLTYFTLTWTSNGFATSETFMIQVFDVNGALLTTFNSLNAGHANFNHALEGWNYVVIKSTRLTKVWSIIYEKSSGTATTTTVTSTTTTITSTTLSTTTRTSTTATDTTTTISSTTTTTTSATLSTTTQTSTTATATTTSTTATEGNTSTIVVGSNSSINGENIEEPTRPIVIIVVSIVCVTVLLGIVIGVARRMMHSKLEIEHGTHGSLTKTNVSMVVANKAFDPTAAVAPPQLFSIPLANDTTGNVSNAPGQAAAVVMDAPLGRNANSFKVPVRQGGARARVVSLTSPVGDSESIVDLSVSPRPRAKTQWGNEMHNPTNKSSSSLYDTASPADHANAVDEDGAEAASSQAVYSFAAASGNSDDFDASVSALYHTASPSPMYDAASPADHANAVDEDGAEAASSQAIYSFAAASGNSDDFDASVSVGSAIYSLTTNTNETQL